jgi:hypothetical protein
MNIFNLGSISFDAIRKEYENNLKSLDPDTIIKNKRGKGNSASFYYSKFYKIFLASVYKTINSLEKGKNKQYFKYINQSQGDYLKRKGGNVSSQMISHAEFIESFIKKSGNPNLQYSLLGIFVDIWKILNDQKWKQAFKRAFSYSNTTGQTNTLITSFRMIYIALVIAFESIGLKMLSFEYDVHTGIDPENSVINIMNRHTSFMKSVAIPIIRIICICRNVKDPMKMVDEIIINEEEVKKAKKKAGESKTPYGEKELTVMESYKIEQMDNTLQIQSREALPAIPLVTTAISHFLGMGVAGGAGGTAAAAGVTTAALGPVLGLILLIAVSVVLVIFATPATRLIIYYVNMHKVDLQKELEMQAELLNNNILSLQEKMEKASDEKERARLQNIINKQIGFLINLQSKIKKYVDDEYDASLSAIQQAQTDEQADGPTDKGYGDGSSSDDFEIDI